MKRIWGLAAAAVLLVAAAVTAVLVFTDDAEPVAATCENGVSVYFSSDDTMRAAAEQLRDDDRVGAVVTENRAQALERGGEFAPVLAKSVPTRPGVTFTAPAVHLAANGVTKAELADDLRELPEAEAAVPVDCGESPEQRAERMVDLSDQLTCTQPWRLYFTDDASMQAAVEPLRDDPRVASVRGVTMAQAFEEAKELFADDPEMLELLRPDQLPPSVEVLARPGTDPQQLGEEYRRKLAGADELQYDPTCFGIPHPVSAK